MANDIAKHDPADGQRALAWRALNLLTSTTDRIVAELGADAPVAIDAGLSKTEHELRPVPAGGADRAQWETAIDERLRRLAVKVAPTAGAEQTQEWRFAMIEALSDLPALIALTAAKRAIHRPFRFIGDIESAIREIATELLAEREGRLRGLRRMQADLARAMAPPAALPAPLPDVPIPAAHIRAIPAPLRAIGLKIGALTADQVEAALAA